MKNNKKHSLREKLIPILFMCVLGGFFILNRVLPVPEILMDERRPVAKFPTLTTKSVSETKFMRDFELWTADNFAFRKEFRTLHTETVFNLFFQTDRNGLYLGASGAGKFEELHEANLRQSLAKIKTVESTLRSYNIDSFRFAFIPDKSLYAGRYYPGFDPKQVRAIIASEFSEKDNKIETVDITDLLSSSDFYRTDLHWNQTQIVDVAGFLLQPGSDGSSIKERSSIVTAIERVDPRIGGEFTGVYPGQLALSMNSDTLRYFPIEDIYVTYLNEKSQTMVPGELYKKEALTESVDPYDFFLSGAQPLIVLKNTKADSARTLYLFRDSFGSSIAPLFAASGMYKEVVCIDLRYIDLRILDQVISFTEDADVLFLYSTQILNNPSVILVG